MKKQYLRLFTLLTLTLVAPAIGGCAPKPAADQAAQIEFDPNAPIALTTTDDFAATDATQAGDAKTLTLNGVDLVFHYIPAGQFTMGASKDVWNAYVEKAAMEKDAVGLFMATYDETPHEVTLTDGYWLAETETTQDAWLKLMGTDPSADKGAALPVTKVAWNDCQQLLEKLNAIENKPEGWKFALPTEAQWEFACRAGSDSLYANGDALTEKDARCAGDDPASAKEKLIGNDSPVEVGRYAANAWGLKDMHGNVWEWVNDVYAKYPNEARANPLGPLNGPERVCRGGCWSVDSFYCRSARRSKTNSNMGYSYIGFRLALVPDGPEPERLPDEMIDTTPVK